MFYNHSKVYVFLGYFFSFALCENSWALPSYQRLWEKKYGYTTSCMLCHSKGGGSQLGGYGEDFQRFGMTSAAFANIEKRDSDKDGFTNIDEIRAKANPDDPLSTPAKPTDWLSRIEDSMLPMEELKKIFPEIKKFSLLEGTLFPDQIKQIENGLSEKLSEADAVPTFYFAIKDQNEKLLRIGVAVFSTPTSNPEKLIVGIGADLSGKITNVVLIKNKLNDKLSDKNFLSQFKGKSLESSMQINKDIQPAAPELAKESAQVIEATKKSLLIIYSVFNKDKKTVNPK
jgi:hypothetical protein